jgi:protein-tyrosine phosphatase
MLPPSARAETGRAILVAMRILFVCMGNICRSPTAEGVMRSLLREAGLDGAVAIDSAGTGGWHAGEPPDERATAAARRRGIELDGAARQVRPADFRDFDLLIAMDRRNQRELQALAPDDEARAKVRLLREFDPASAGAADVDVPDPYYGGDRGFEDVLDMVEAACRGLLDELRARV